MRMWPHSRVLTILAASLAAAVGVHAEMLLPLPNAGFEEGLAGWADSSKAPMGTVMPEAAQSGAAGLRVVDARPALLGAHPERQRHGGLPRVL